MEDFYGKEFAKKTTRKENVKRKSWKIFTEIIREKSRKNVKKKSWKIFTK